MVFFFNFTGNITLLYWSNWGLTGCSGFPKQLFRQAERLFQWPQTFRIQLIRAILGPRENPLPSLQHTGAEPGEIKCLTRLFAAPSWHLKMMRTNAVALLQDPLNQFHFHCTSMKINHGELARCCPLLATVAKKRRKLRCVLHIYVLTSWTKCNELHVFRRPF